MVFQRASSGGTGFFRILARSSISFHVLKCEAGMVGVNVGMFSRIISANCRSESSPTGSRAFAMVSSSSKFSGFLSQHCAFRVACTIAATALGLACAVLRSVTTAL